MDYATEVLSKAAEAGKRDYAAEAGQNDRAGALANLDHKVPVMREMGRDSCLQL
jgi:hypothetical protein